MPAMQEQATSSHEIPSEKHLTEGPEEKSLWENTLKLLLKLECCTIR